MLFSSKYCSLLFINVPVEISQILEIKGTAYSIRTSVTQVDPAPCLGRACGFGYQLYINHCSFNGTVAHLVFCEHIVIQTGIFSPVFTSYSLKSMVIVMSQYEHMYIHIYVHIYMYVFICVCIYVCMITSELESLIAQVVFTSIFTTRIFL